MSNENSPEVEQPRASGRRGTRPDSASGVRRIEWLCVGLAVGVLAEAVLAGKVPDRSPPVRCIGSRVGRTPSGSPFRPSRRHGVHGEGIGHAAPISTR
jgi:hypothetical protein